jgi:hypothetical protein
MTLVISKGITLRNQLPADAEADAYIAAVEAADGQALESGVKFAIKNFVLCCKQDGIWNAIKASCILAGARTLTGALVPLVGTAPTNVDGLFVSGDYNRKTGLVGNGSTKYLNSNRNNNADPQDSKHIAIYASQANSEDVNRGYIGVGVATNGPSNIFTRPSTSEVAGRINRNGSTAFGVISSAGFLGVSRFSSNSTNSIAAGVITSDSNTSQEPRDESILVFGRNGVAESDARLAFYSIGESLDLALLDARVTDLINAFAAAIP